jgi:hypothetical protein
MNGRRVMRSLLAYVLTGLFLLPMLASAAARIRQEQVQFGKGESGTTVTGTIQGDQIVDYQLRAGAGQTMVADFKPSNLSAYFNVLPPPGSETAIFVGSISGNHFEGTLPADGVYTVRVYLMRNAARRNESTRYTLKVAIAGRDKSAGESGASSTTAVFDRTLELQGIRFHVTSADEGSINTLRIVPSGLEIDNSPIERTIDGTVTGAEVADLNVDGSPEIYVYVTSAGSGSYGSLVAYSANRRKSLSAVHLPSLKENKAAAKGYMGHDEFAVVESTLVRRFPVYRDGDSNANPTGGMRQLQYKLAPGETGWLLRLDKVVEY